MVFDMRRAIILIVLLAASLTFARERYSTAGQIRLDNSGRKWAQKTLRKLTLEEKVGQLFMIWVRARFLNTNDPAYLQLRDSIRKYHVGSLAMTVDVDSGLLQKNQPYEAAALLNRLQSESVLPLLVAADFERGVSMRLNGTTVFPHAMAFGAAGKPEYAEAFGRITGVEARAIGVHWNFFPDADVNSNPANPIINTRSFGEDPQQVADLVAAYIKGAHQASMLATAKHFPGHGDTDSDSHLGVARVNGDLARLERVELPPFQRAIAAGVDAVMVAHVTAPALEPDPNRVATTSAAVVTDLLRHKLGFQGLVVTDALDMAGLTRLYAPNVGRAAVDAFKAGNDLLIIPADLDASYKAMLAAVQSGEISQARLDESVLKVLDLKASLDLQKARLVDLGRLDQLVAIPENIAFGQKVAEEALTLVRDNGQVLPLRAAGTFPVGLPYQASVEVRNRLVVVVFAEDVRSESGRVLERWIRTRAPDVHVFYTDPRLAGAMSEEILKAADEAETVVAALYITPTAGKVIQVGNELKNSVGMADAAGTLLQKLLDRAASKMVVAAMGNPYLAEDFPAVQTYFCAFSNTSVSEIAAAKALFGGVPFNGHLPITIPGVAQRGAGIEHPKQVQSGGISSAHP